MFFICQEAKEFVHDIECINYLIELCKKDDIDTNCYYELNYYKHKLQNWEKLGIGTDLIKAEAESLLAAINVLLMTVTDEKATELLGGKIIYDFSDFDKLKYTNSNGFKGKIGVTRNIYPIGFEDNLAEKLLSFLLTLIFAPTVSVLVCMVVFSLTTRLNITLGFIVYFIIVGFHFIKFMREIYERIVYLYYYKINKIAYINRNEEYIFRYTRTPRKIEEIKDRVLRARYMLENEICLQNLLYTYKYYVTNYHNDKSSLCVVLPDDSELNAKFFFDIYAKAEFELDKYLKEQYQLELKHKSEQSASMEEMINSHLSQYNYYIN